MQMPLFHDMFALTLPVAEKVLRPMLVYAFLIIGLRLAGKRELAQLNPFDFVLLLTISNTVQNAIIGNDNSVTGGLIGAATLFLVNHLGIRFFYGNRLLEQLVEGESTALIKHGRLQTAALRKELITPAELKTSAHEQGFATFDEIDHAQLDPSGRIVFFAKKPSPDEARHEDIMKRLDQISAQVAALRA